MLCLLIACRAVVMFIVSSPFGVLRTVRHLWQNQSWGGKWSGLCSLGMQLLWYTWLHSAHALDFVLVIFCRGVSFLHWVHIFSGSGLLSRWMNALGSLWSGNSVTRRMRPVRGCPWSCAGLSVTFWPCRCRCCGLSIGFKVVFFHVCGVVKLSFVGFPCAIRHTSSHASRCLS